eukprot:gene10227-3410_t
MRGPPPAAGGVRGRRARAGAPLLQSYISHTDRTGASIAAWRGAFLRALSERRVQVPPGLPEEVLQLYKKGTLRRRQDLPDEAFASHEEVKEYALQHSRSVLVISHGWLTWNHPDPEGLHLQQLVRYGWFGRPLPDNVLVFWDYASLPQCVRSAHEVDDKGEKKVLLEWGPGNFDKFRNALGG